MKFRGGGHGGRGNHCGKWTKGAEKDLKRDRRWEKPSMTEVKIMLHGFLRRETARLEGWEKGNLRRRGGRGIERKCLLVKW